MNLSLYEQSARGVHVSALNGHVDWKLHIKHLTFFLVIKQIIQNAKEKGKDEEDRVKSIIKEALKDVIDELNLATKEDIQNLEKKFEK